MLLCIFMKLCHSYMANPSDLRNIRYKFSATTRRSVVESLKLIVHDGEGVLGDIAINH